MIFGNDIPSLSLFLTCTIVLAFSTHMHTTHRFSSGFVQSQLERKYTNNSQHKQGEEIITLSQNNFWTGLDIADWWRNLPVDFSFEVSRLVIFGVQMVSLQAHPSLGPFKFVPQIVCLKHAVWTSDTCMQFGKIRTLILRLIIFFL